MNSAAANPMVVELLSVICIFGIVVIGLLIMVQAVTSEELVKAVGRLSLFTVLVLVAGWFIKTVLVCVAIPWLLSIQAFLVSVVIVIAALLVTLLIVRAMPVLSKNEKHDEG